MDEFDEPTMPGLKVGDRLFNRFLLQAHVGQGGFGMVWKAWDESLGEEVAFKCLTDKFRDDPNALNDLKEEIRRSRCLQHRNIIRVYEFCDDKQWPGFTMEFVDGPTLSTLREEQPSKIFEVDDIRRWVSQLCDALYYAHEDEHVVHRDLKPSNLMVDKRGRLKIADFGIACRVSKDNAEVRHGPSGTRGYNSPQQAKGGVPSIKDDIYSLGATIYSLLTGRPPTKAKESDRFPSMTEKLKEMGISCAPIPDAWEATVAACLSANPDDRPASAHEIQTRLSPKAGTAAQFSLPSKPEGLTTTAGNQEVRLKWFEVPGATSYNIKRGTSENGPFTAITVIQGKTQYTDPGLRNGTTYFYTVAAVNPVGTSEDSEVSGACPLAPPLPPHMEEPEIGSERVHVRWLASKQATEYRVLRSEGGNEQFGEIAKTSDTFYLDTKVRNKRTYRYVVEAVNNAGSSPFSEEVEATPEPPPPPVGQPRATALDGRIRLQWTLPQEAVGAKIMRAEGREELVHIASVTGASAFEDSGLENGFEYRYEISAYNEGGLLSTPVSVLCTPQGPPPPVENLILAASAKAIILRWAGVDEALCYDLERKDGALETWKTIRENIQQEKPGETIECRDREVEGNRDYEYRVRARNAAGYVEPISIRTGRLIPVPDPPSQVQIQPSSGACLVRWQASPGAKSYILRRSKDGESKPWTQQVQATEYLDEGLSNGVKLWYAIRAENSSGLGEWTPEIAAVPQERPPKPEKPKAAASNREVRVHWKSVEGAVGYYVYKALNPDQKGTRVETVPVRRGNEFLDTDVENGRDYYYSLQSYNASGESEISEQVVARPMQPPDPVRDIEVSVSDRAVRLSWQPVEHARSYKIFRSEEGQVGLLEIGETPEFKCLDDTVSNGTTYRYRVTPVGEAGPGAASEMVTARPPGAINALKGKLSRLAIPALIVLVLVGVGLGAWLQFRPMTRGLDLASDPAGAALIVDGRKTGQVTPLTLPMEEGSYEIRLELEGYEPFQLKAELAGKQVIQTNVSLSRLKGWLNVASQPEEGLLVRVLKAGKEIQTGRTPWLEQLESDRYEVEVMRQGWPSYRETLEVGASITNQVLARFVPAPVEITSDPQGAVILWGNKLLGKTGTLPLRTNLPPGEVILTGQLSPLDDQVKKVQLVSGSSQTIHFDFPYLTVKLLSKPSGAEIRDTETGRLVGITPYSTNYFPAGNRNLEFRLPEYVTAVVRTNFDKSKYKEIQVNLQRDISALMGALRLETLPQNIEIKVQSPDGATRVYHSPTNVPAPEGSYVVSIERPGWEAVRTPVQVRRNETASFFYKFAQGQVQFKLDPPDAKVQRKGEVEERPSGSTYILPAQTWQYFTVRHSSLPEIEFPFKVDDGENSVQTLRLPHGSVIVDTQPSGLKVGVFDVQGKEIGKTPYTNSVVPPGRVQYRLSLPGYEDVTVSGVIPETSTGPLRLTSTMKVATGLLLVKGTLSQAEILLDDSTSVLGRLNQEIPGVPVGRHQVTVRVPGFEPLVRDLTIQKNLKSEFSISPSDLIPEQGSLLMSVVPEKVDFTLVPKVLTIQQQVEPRTGSTVAGRPSLIRGLPRGTYALRLTGSVPQYPLEATVTIEEGKTNSQSYKLPYGWVQIPTQLPITVSLNGSVVIPDGNRGYPVPSDRDVVLNLQSEGYEPAILSVRVPAQETLQKAANLNLWVGPRPGQSWTNSLGMAFLPVGNVHMAVTETPHAYYYKVSRVRNRVVRGTSGYPQANVSVKDVDQFAEWLLEDDRKAGVLGDGYRYRMPTETEWKQALGWTSSMQFYWGNAWPPPVGTFNAGESISFDGHSTASRVGTYLSNQSGFFEMVGNLAEWVTTSAGNPGILGYSFRTSRIQDLRNPVVQSLNQPSNDEVGFRLVIERTR